MKYIDRVLGPNEEIVYETGLHWIVLAAPIVGLAFAAFAGSQTNFNDIGKTQAPALVFVVFGLISLVAVCKSLINLATTEIAVTTHRIVFKRGLIARDTIEINFNRIEGLDIKQTIIGRILNYGAVIVRGTGIGVQPMRDIAAPLELRKAAFGDIKTAQAASSPIQLRSR